MTALPHPAYIAGIIDGEGSVFTRRRGLPTVTAASTCRPLIDTLLLLGGAAQHRQRLGGLAKKESWEWGISGERAALVLRACRPYLVVKALRADSVLLAWDTTPTVRSRQRRTAILRARLDMAALGWPVVGPDPGPEMRSQGHVIDGENAYVVASGTFCNTCRKAAAARYRERRAA